MSDPHHPDSRDAIRVLHVDDEPHEREFVKLFLEEADPSLHVEAVSTPEEALRMLEQPYDCVVSDYLLREMDGIELARMIRETSSIPFILYTGRGSEEEASAAFVAGIDDYLRKELNRSHYLVLAKRIRAAVEKHSAEEQLRDSEEMLRNVFIASPVGITVTDMNGNIIECNQSMLDMHGYTSKEELIGKSVIMLISKKDHERAMENMKKTLEQGSVRNVEYTFLNKDGLEFQVELFASVIRDVSGSPTTFVAITKDITERKRMEKQLLQSERLAAIGQLASIVGHELRNPLGVIKNSAYYLGLRLMDDADEKVARHLEILEREVARSNNIISDLLDFARGPRPPTLQPIDLNQLVEEALSRVEVPAGVETVPILGELHQLRADPDQILRAILNLMMNGVEAMPEGGTLRLKTRAGEDFVEVSVTDTGIGIPEENMGNLFTPLFSTKAKGIGLGLYISKGVVEAHNGTITVESKVGEGSTFTIRLPIVEEDRR